MVIMRLELATHTNPFDFPSTASRDVPRLQRDDPSRRHISIKAPTGENRRILAASPSNECSVFTEMALGSERETDVQLI